MGAVTAEKCLSAIVRSASKENLSMCKASILAPMVELA